MHNIMLVLRRDIKRLLKAPAALAVVLAILIFPSAYTWYNVAGFWNPYDNTSYMRVAVVNQDTGATSNLTGELNVGSLIVEKLSENHQLDWVFCDYDTAMDEISAGKDFAAFVIPANFTKDLLSVTTGDIKQPTIQYYVNEKTGPVAPKVTDTGASTLERMMNSSFVQTVSDAAVEALTKTVDESKIALDAARSEASQKVGQAQASIADARSALRTVSVAIGDARSKSGDAINALNKAKVELASAAGDLNELSRIAKEMQETLPESTAAALDDLTKALALLESLPWDVIGKKPEEVQQAIELLQHAISSLTDTAVPEAAKALAQVSATAAELSAIFNEQQITMDQALAVLNQLDGTLASSQTAIAKTDELLGGISSDVETVYTDVVALSKSSLISRLTEESGLDAQRISDFIGSPTTLETIELYPIKAYGFAMAPLFLSLTFWIGAYMWLIVMRQEVDDEGIKKLTINQRYISRFVFFAFLSVMQAIICCLGCLILGVEVASIPAFFIAGAVASLSYLSIIYALSTVLQHIGKGLCVVLVFIQIPAATGLYPIELTAPFYQAISPFFPFTYGIGAMREAICGFYGTTFAADIGMLLLFLVIFMLFGLIFRPLMANVSHMTAGQLKESGIYNSQPVEIPEHRFTIGQILRLVANEGGYRSAIQERYEKFERLYPKLVRGSAIIGIVVPIVITVVLSITTSEKVIVLVVWLVWVIIMFVFLVVMETIRHNIRRQLELDDASARSLAQQIVGSNVGMPASERDEEAADA